MEITQLKYYGNYSIEVSWKLQLKYYGNYNWSIMEITHMVRFEMNAACGMSALNVACVGFGSGLCSLQVTVVTA